MKKVIAILVVGMLAFTALAGTATAGTWVLKYLAYAKSDGWYQAGTVGQYEIWGHYNYFDRATWREHTHNGVTVIYIPGHEVIHSNYDLKTVDSNTGKTVAMTHYNGMYIVRIVGPFQGYLKQFKVSAYGYLRVKWWDTTAPAFWYPGLSPALTKVKLMPTTEDTANVGELLTEVLLASGLNLADLPNIKSLEIFDETGQGYVLTAV